MMAKMTKSSLSPAQRRTLEIVEKLVFGRIEGLSVRDGQPCYNPAPRIEQQIKLGSERQPQPLVDNPDDFTLQKEFASLFDQLSGLRNAIVEIEIRHGLPFRLLVERHFEELL